MATIWEIDDRLTNAIEHGIDVDTGEIINSDLLSEIEMELNDKIEGIAQYIVNLNAEATAIKEQKKILDERQKSKERKAESLKEYLNNYFTISGIDKFETDKIKISYRKSTEVKVDDVSLVPDKFIKPRVLKDSDVSKSDIKAYLSQNPDEVINGIHILEKRNMSIK